MNIRLKTKEEIKLMEEGGKRLKEVVEELSLLMIPGTTTKEIDLKAGELIKKKGGEASFKKVKGYYWNTCLPINEQIVHTPPSARVLKSGDILTIDIGFYFRGFNTDYANSVIIGNVEDKQKKIFLEVGRSTLKKAISRAKAGNRLGEISQEIEKGIEGAGYRVIKNLTGHGIGRKLHEDPFVPGFLDKPLEKTLVIKPGLVVAIEVIYSLSSEDFDYENDDQWSLVAADGSISACFEHTIAVTDKNTLILT